MANDPDNIYLGPCNVSWNGTDLGFTMDNSVTITSELATSKITPDQSGSPVKEYVTGQDVMISMTLGETDREKLKLVMYGTYDTGTNNGVAFADPIGTNILASAGELIITPMDVTNPNVYIAPKASPKTNLNIAFSKEAATTAPIVFQAYPDTTYGTHPTLGTGVQLVIEDPTT